MARAAARYIKVQKNENPIGNDSNACRFKAHQLPGAMCWLKPFVYNPRTRIVELANSTLFENHQK
jgi:hypothetical protein